MRALVVVLALALAVTTLPTAAAGCHPACAPIHEFEHYIRDVPLRAGAIDLFVSLLPAWPSFFMRCC